jgi:branched-chain amino acid transport system substrate-binding protein
MKKRLIFSGLILFAMMVGSVNCITARAEEPIVIAHIDALSGPYRSIGYPVKLMLEFYVEQVNAQGGLLGRPVKLLTYDNEMKPDVALRQAKRAILEDKAKFITQTGTSAIALALSKLAVAENVIHVVMKSEATEITGKDFQENTFRCCLSTEMHAIGLAEYFKDRPEKKFFFVGPDFSFGRDAAASFKKVLKRLKPDSELVGEIFHPFSVKDFGPYVTKIMGSGAEVIFVATWGPDLINFIKQGRSLGMKQVLGCFYLDNADVMNVVGDDALGSVTNDAYLATIPTDKNKAFLKNWKEWFKKNHPNEPATYIVPSSNGFVVQVYGFLTEVIKKAGSVEADKIRSTWEEMSFEGLNGVVRMRKCDHQLLTPTFVGTVERDHPLKDVFSPPYVGVPVTIPMVKVTVPQGEIENPRCK